MVAEGWLVVTGGELFVQSPFGTGLRFLSPALRARAGLSATLRGQPGPALRRQKSEARSGGRGFLAFFHAASASFFSLRSSR